MISAASDSERIVKIRSTFGNIIDKSKVSWFFFSHEVEYLFM